MSDCVWPYGSQPARHLCPCPPGSRQEYQSGLPCPPPGDLSDPGIKPTSLMSLTLVGRFFTTRSTWEARLARQGLLFRVSGNFQTKLRPLIFSPLFIYSAARTVWMPTPPSLSCSGAPGFSAAKVTRAFLLVCSLSKTCVTRRCECRLFCWKDFVCSPAPIHKAPERWDPPEVICQRAGCQRGPSGNASLMLAPWWLVESVCADKGGFRLNVTQKP